LELVPEPASPGGVFADLFDDARTQRLRAGTVLFNEGDVSNRVALVMTGRLKISSYAEDGRETVLGFRDPGDVLGEFAAIDGDPHLATVTAIEPTEVAVVPADRFLAELEARPELTLALLRSVIGRLRDADRKRIEFGALDVVARVARRLVELAESHGETSPGGVSVTITQAELAGWASCSREAVNKSLHRLRERGLVALGRGHVTVVDLEGLRRRSAG
jgi:CRP-like cAMP-binding protein